MSKSMLISVGGTLAPLIYTLNQTRPRYIIFFASPQTKESITYIMDSLDFRPSGTDHIIAPSAEILGDCYATLVEQLPHKLETWGIEPSQLLVDYTGGTKTMSAALVLATTELGCDYSYVGGPERDKDGVGVVLDGREKMWYVHNPWDELAVSERRRATLLFNRARYAAACEAMQDACVKVSDAARPYYETWLSIMTAYELWDRFNHRQARITLETGFRQLTLVACRSSELQSRVAEISSNLSFLREAVEGRNSGMLLVYDLIANAKRRADMEGKYDDAVARLYRAVEKTSQERLRLLGIDSSGVDPAQLPASLRNEYLNRYQNDRGKLKLPLYASYRLLEALGDETGASFFQRYDSQIRPLLDMRNSSILAHGDLPITDSSYRKLLDVVMQFIPVEEGHLPIFPELHL